VKDETMANTAPKTDYFMNNLPTFRAQASSPARSVREFMILIAVKVATIINDVEKTGRSIRQRRYASLFS
jgi:hypothetical protein